METEAVAVPPAVDADLFRRTCARFATGVAIATVTGQDGLPYGLTINSFTSVSCCPPLILICIDQRCSLLPHFRASSWFGLSILEATQKDISIRFAVQESDRFEDMPFDTGITGVPLLRNALANFECAIAQVIEAGDHVMFLAEVSRAEWRLGEPLIYFASEYRSLNQR